MGFTSAFIFLLGVVGEVRAQANFYAGKTVTVIVGSAPGGLYDLWGRLLARTMGKYISGNPTMLVQNMPGGGSIHSYFWARLFWLAAGKREMGGTGQTEKFLGATG